MVEAAVSKIENVIVEVDGELFSLLELVVE